MKQNGRQCSTLEVKSIIITLMQLGPFYLQLLFPKHKQNDKMTTCTGKQGCMAKIYFEEVGHEEGEGEEGKEERV